MWTASKYLTNLDFDTEIDRLQLYMEAYVAVCFDRPVARYNFPTFAEFSPGQRFTERKVYTHHDGSYITAQRTYLQCCFVKYNFSPWVMSDPVQPPKVKQEPLQWDMSAARAIANFRAERNAEQLERMTR